MAKRAGIMLCHPFEEKRLSKWEPPYIIQPKLDGERCRAMWHEDKIILLSSEENLITSVPHINAHLKKTLSPHTELDGELYIHGWSFEEIHSVVSRTVNLHPQYHKMEFHVFDIITDKLPQGERISLLKSLCEYPIVHVPYHIASTLEEIMTWYNEYLDQDYEGIIIRNMFYPYERKRSTGIMKFKPKKTDHYQIVECLEAIDKHGKPKEMLGAFLCVGDDGTYFKVGAGTLTHEERYLIWADRFKYVGLACEVQYQNITSNGIPRFGLCFKKPSEAWEDEASPFDVLGIRR